MLRLATVFLFLAPCYISNVVAVPTLSLHQDVTAPSRHGPSEPQNVTAAALSSSSVRVRWEPPAQSQGAIIEYRVTISKKSFFLATWVDGTVLTSDITGLQADTEYKVRVAAFSSAGPGRASTPCTVHTPPKALVQMPALSQDVTVLIPTPTLHQDVTLLVPSEPQKVTATALSSSSVRVRWEPPAQSQGAIINYLVTIMTRSTLFAALVDGTALGTDINGLQADTDYEVTVAAASSAGNGPPSTPCFVHTPSQGTSQKRRRIPTLLLTKWWKMDNV